MKKVVIYTRFSPRRNEDTCESCEKQAEYCQDYCLRKGYIVRGVYSDKAMSGANADRPGLWEAIKALRPGDTLLVYTRDRLARDMMLSEVIYQEVKKKGCDTEAVSGDVEGSDNNPTVVLVRQVMAAIAQFQRATMAARTSAAMLHHQANGRRMSKIPPYGMMSDPLNSNLLIDNPVERKIIEEIKALKKNGYSLYKITKELNKARPEMCRGKCWHLNAVKRILLRELEE